ncbi:MAG TPA: shikimate kinase [Gemmataceae bacterium]|nr:shikimate kinase [Gemmataceae bacterium]
MSAESASPQPRNIFLVGYRATGKTTVAGRLAKLLGWAWCDADVILEQRAGRSIRQIFADEGEAGFRRRESEVLADLCQRDRHVIATGGGIILAEANRARLRSAGLVVWLRADPATLWTRLSQDATTAQRRPDLTVGGREEIEALLRQREPLYREVAEVDLDTVGRTPDDLAAAIVAHWQNLPYAVQKKEL